LAYFANEEFRLFVALLLTVQQSNWVIVENKIPINFFVYSMSWRDYKSAHQHITALPN
jgi:hypothetical protein